jgi:hypothetical protein
MANNNGMSSIRWWVISKVVMLQLYDSFKLLQNLRERQAGDWKRAGFHGWPAKDR